MRRVLALAVTLLGCGEMPRIDACSSAHSCGSAGAYWQLCTSEGGQTAYYATSDGKRFACAGDDCTAAGKMAADWCAAQ